MLYLTVEVGKLLGIHLPGVTVNYVSSVYLNYYLYIYKHFTFVILYFVSHVTCILNVVMFLGYISWKDALVGR